MNEVLNMQLQKALSLAGMTQKQLADKVGITEASVSHYLKGDRSPRASVISKMADALGCKAEFLLGTNVSNDEDDFDTVYRMMARSAKQFTPEEKAQLVKILFKEG